MTLDMSFILLDSGPFINKIRELDGTTSLTSSGSETQIFLQLKIQVQPATQFITKQGTKMISGYYTSLGNRTSEALSELNKTGIFLRGSMSTLRQRDGGHQGSFRGILG